MRKFADPFRPSALLVEVREAFASKGLSVLGRAAKRLEELERGAQQRELFRGLPLPVAIEQGALRCNRDCELRAAITVTKKPTKP